MQGKISSEFISGHSLSSICSFETFCFEVYFINSIFLIVDKLFFILTGIQMLTLLVPILINFLLEGDTLQQGTKYQISLHQQSFQWLNKIGPKYPQVCLFFSINNLVCFCSLIKFIYIFTH